MLRENHAEELSFTQLALMRKNQRWNKHWLKTVLDTIRWDEFDSQFKKLYSKRDGRPAWNPLVLFRCLLLQKWYGMSDRQLEEALEFRVDFCKFAGLNFEEDVPDATTFVVFRNRIQPKWDSLLEILNRQIESAGFEIKKAITVDATLVSAHSKPCGNKQFFDNDGAWRGFPAKQIETEDGEKIVARRPALFGYKINLSTSISTGFINGFSVCKASEHETHHLLEFIRPATRVVYADKGYVGNRSELESRKIIDGIQAKATRNAPLSQLEISRNKKITSKRRIVEAVFGSWKQWYDWHKTKYIGLCRNCLAVALTSLAWNMKKWAVLAR